MKNGSRKLKVILRTKDNSLVSVIVNERPPKGVTVSFEETPFKGVIDTDNATTIVISALLSVPVSLFANWLWSKMKGADKSTTKITINNQSVNITQTSIFQILDMEFKVKGDATAEQEGHD